MKFKELLYEIDNLNRKIKIEYQKLEFYHIKSFSVPGPLYGVERIKCQPSGKAPFQKWIDLEFEKKMEIEKMENKLFDLKSKAINFLDANADVNTMFIIAYHFLEGLSYSKVAEKMQLARSTVFRMKDKAEKTLFNLEI